MSFKIHVFSIHSARSLPLSSKTLYKQSQDWNHYCWRNSPKHKFYSKFKIWVKVNLRMKYKTYSQFYYEIVKNIILLLNNLGF